MSTQLEENYAKGDWLVRNKFTDQTHSIHTTPAKATAKMHDLNSKDLEQKLNSGKDNGHTYESPYHAVLASHHYSKAQNPYHNTKTNESVEILDEAFETGKVYHIQHPYGGRDYFIPHELQKNKKHKGLQFDGGASGRSKNKPTTGSYQHSDMWVKTPSDEIPDHISSYLKNEDCHNESVVEMFESIISGELNESKNITSSILVSKIAQKLEERKIEVAQSFINPVI